MYLFPPKILLVYANHLRMLSVLDAYCLMQGDKRMRCRELATAALAPTSVDDIVHNSNPGGQHSTTVQNTGNVEGRKKIELTQDIMAAYPASRWF